MAVSNLPLGGVLPKQVDNTYRGLRLGLWLFVPIVLLELLIGANSMLNPRFVASSADGIPLGSYGPAAGDAVVSLFALLGLCRILFALQGVLVLVRYRSLIPFMYLVMLLLHLASKLVVFAHPIVRSAAGAGGSPVVLGLIAALAVGLVLSLTPRAGKA